MFKSNDKFDGNPLKIEDYLENLKTEIGEKDGSFLIDGDTSAPRLHQDISNKLAAGTEDNLTSEEQKRYEIYKTQMEKRKQIAFAARRIVQTSCTQDIFNEFTAILAVEDDITTMVEKFKQMWKVLTRKKKYSIAQESLMTDQFGDQLRALTTAQNDKEAHTRLLALQQLESKLIICNGGKHKLTTSQIRATSVRILLSSDYSAVRTYITTEAPESTNKIIEKFLEDSSTMRQWTPHDTTASKSVAFKSDNESVTVSAAGTDRNDRLDKMEKTLTDIVQQISGRRDRSRERTPYHSDRGSDRTQQHSERNRYTERERDDGGNGREWNFNRDSGRDRRSNSRERSRSRDYYGPPSSRPRDNQHQSQRDRSGDNRGRSPNPSFRNSRERSPTPRYQRDREGAGY